MTFVQIVQALRGSRRDRTRLAEVFDNMPLFTEDRDHAQILSQSPACVLPALTFSLLTC